MSTSTHRFPSNSRMEMAEGFNLNCWQNPSLLHRIVTGDDKRCFIQPIIQESISNFEITVVSTQAEIPQDRFKGKVMLSCSNLSRTLFI
ncbi:hypothetical protein TNCV_1054971 [Trichonephila clavipes]|nr:hypothetical protein TNCV_1054971 [Trichonephila clavipes]